MMFRYTHAVGLLQAAQYEEAIQQLDMVIRVLPKFAQAYHYRGLAFYHNVQKDMALEDFNMAIDLKPDFAEAFRNRGVLRVTAGDVLGGLTDLDRALALFEEAGNSEMVQDILDLLEGEGK